MLVKGATDILYSINLQAAKTKMFYLMNFIDIVPKASEWPVTTYMWYIFRKLALWNLS